MIQKAIAVFKTWATDALVAQYQLPRKQAFNLALSALSKLSDDNVITIIRAAGYQWTSRRWQKRQSRRFKRD